MIRKLITIFLFLRINYEILAGMILGCIAGYFYWEWFGIMWGNYSLSSECWVNCLYGSLFGGFIASLFSKVD
jgi:hypothetical protein